MNANVEFLNYIYQNSQMGVDTLEQLMDITEDEKLQAQLEKQQATLEYVAAMADIDLPVEETAEGTDIDEEEEE